MADVQNPANAIARRPETPGDLKNGVYFAVIQPQGGFVNPFTGASMGRTLVGELPMKSKTTGNTQRRPVSGGGQASRVRDLQLRINELERSATSMYSQHAGAALALEREVAQLREERLRLTAASGGAAGTAGAAASSKRHSSAPGKARNTWLLPASPKMKQSSDAHRLSQAPSHRQPPQARPSSSPGRPRTSPAAGGGGGGGGDGLDDLRGPTTKVISAREQREAASRMSSGGQAQPLAMEAFLPNATDSGSRSQQRPRTPLSGAGPGVQSALLKVKTAKGTPVAAGGSRSKAFEAFVNNDNFLMTQGPGGGGGGSPKSWKAQTQRMTQLSVPTREIREKVVTEGVSKTEAEWLMYNAAQTPGPGAYKQKGAAELIPGGRFSKASPLSEVDRLVMEARNKPGPGQYKQKGAAELTPGGRFSNAAPLSEVDRLVLESRHKPGPGAYGHINLDHTGHKLLGEGGQGFSKSAPPSHTEILMKRAAQTPGPGQYRLKGADELIPGGGFSTATPLSEVDRMVMEARNKPGPGQYKQKGAAELTPGGRFSTASPLSEVDRLVMESRNKPGPGQYGAPNKAARNTGGSGRFPFVYRPKDPKLKHLTKGYDR